MVVLSIRRCQHRDGITEWVGGSPVLFLPPATSTREAGLGQRRSLCTRRGTMGGRRCFECGARSRFVGPEQKKRKNKRLMMKTQKWTRSHDWIETSTIKEYEYHPWQNKWYPDTYVLTPDDEGAPCGNVLLFLRVTAKSLSSCELRVPSQWSVPIEPVQISVGRWSLELATGASFKCAPWLPFGCADLTRM